jgi:hypothetical protein
MKLMDFWKRFQLAWRRNNGHLPNRDFGHRGQFLPGRQLQVFHADMFDCKAGDELHEAVQGFMASVSQYGFLISCESQISLHNSGPYKLADDREMIVRDFMDLSESDFPWLDGVARDVPYNNLTVTMAVKDCHFYLVDDWGSFESKPEFTSDKLVGVGLYTSDALSESYQPVAMGSREELTACFKSLTDKVKDATNSLWKRIAGWSRDQMMDAGAITYFSIVKDLAHVAGVYDVGDWMTLDERAERFRPLFNDEYSLDGLVGLCIGAHPCTRWPARIIKRPSFRPYSNVAAALWAGHGEYGLDRCVILVAAAGERTGASGIEAPVDKERLIDVKADHLAERKDGAAPPAARRSDLDHLDHLAFQRGWTLGDPRGCDEAAFGHGQPGAGEFVVAAREWGGAFVHRTAQIARRQIGDELAAFPGEGRRVLPTFAGEADDRRRARKAVEKTVRGEIDPPVERAGRNPSDRARRDNRLERVARQLRPIALRRRIEHRDSLRKAGHDFGKRRPRAVLDRRRRPADVDEAGDPLMLGEADGGPKPGVIGGPSGEPGRRQAERARRDDHVHACRARGQDLLPLGNLGVRGRPRDDGDDERRAHKAALLLGAGGLVEVGLVGQTDVERKTACALASPSGEDHEPPGRELSVIGHARGDGQDRGELVVAGGRPRHHRRGNRPAAFEDLDSVVHRRFPSQGLLLGRKPGGCKPPSICLNMGSRAASRATKRRRQIRLREAD